MTSLANQLRVLATPHTQSLFAGDAKRVSLLFDPKEAANHDKDAIFALGHGGLEELIELDSVFAEYEKSLFNESATGLQRLTLTGETNQKIDETVRQFLLQLSPYFLLRSAHKAIEWLLYRYQIHFYNTDDLLVATLPYHDSNIFTRLIQILDLSDPKSKWHWIQPIQKHGSKLPTATIAMHLYKDPGFLNFVAKLPTEFLKLEDRVTVEKNHSASHVAIGFYMKIVTNAVQIAPDTDQGLLPRLVPHLIKGFKSKNKDLKCANYMIFALCATKYLMQSDFLQTILNVITRKMNECCYEVMSLLVIMFNYQAALKLTKKSVRHICSNSSIITTLTQLTQTTADLDKFYTSLIPYIIPAAIKQVYSTGTSSDGGDHTDTGSSERCSYDGIVSALISDIGISDDCARLLIRCLFTYFCSNTHSYLTSETKNAVDEKISTYLKILESRKSKVLDEELSSLSGEGNRKLVQNFSMLTFSSYKYMSVSDPYYKSINLLLALNHHNKNVRARGVEKLHKELLKNQNDTDITELPSSSIEYISDVLTSRLDDDSDRVRAAVLNMDENIIKRYIPAETLLFILIKPTVRKTTMEQVLSILKRSYNMADNDSQVELLCLHSLAPYHAKTLIELINMPANVESSQFVFQHLTDKWKKNEVNIEEKVTTLMSYESLATVLPFFIAHLLNSREFTENDNYLLSRLITSCNNIILQNGELENLDEYKLKSLVTAVALVLKAITVHYNTIESLTSNVPDLFKFLHLLITLKNPLYIVKLCLRWITSDFYPQLLALLLHQDDEIISLNLLGVLEIMLQSQTVPKLKNFYGAVPLALLSKLSCEDKLIRKMSLRLLTALCESPRLKTKSIIEHCINQSREITSDHTNVAQVLSSLRWTSPPTEHSELRRYMSVVNDQSYNERFRARLLLLLSENHQPDILVLLKPELQELVTCSSPHNELLEACLSRFSEHASHLIKQDKQLLDVVVHFIKVYSTYTLSLINKEMFSNIVCEKTQGIILVTVVDLYRGVNSQIQTNITRTFRNLSLPASVIKYVFNPILREKLVPERPGSKKRRMHYEANNIHLLNTPLWLRAITLVEWLQNKKKIREPHLLISPLFTLLKRCNKMSDNSNLDYVKLILVGCLDNVVEKSAKDEDCEVAEQDLNIESLIHVIRMSSNPQTHQQVLLLLRTLSSIHPELILNHIMSIFTYMGANIMRQDDLYSFQIITKTLDTVIPELVKTESANSGSTITGIIRVFIDSYPHIPEHRRKPLFVKLINTVGPDKYLQECSALYVEMTVCNVTLEVVNESLDGEKHDPLTQLQNEESESFWFLLDLYSEFSVSDQINSCSLYLQYLTQLPITIMRRKKPANRRIKSRNRTQNTEKWGGLFNTTTRSDKQLRHYKYKSCQFIAELVSSQTFTEQVVNCELVSLTEDFNSLIESSLCYITAVTSNSEKSTGKPNSKFFRSLLKKSYDMLDKINGLLPVETFIKVIKSLISHELPLIRRKSLDLLNNRLPQTKFDEQQLVILSDIVGDIKTLALHTQHNKDEDSITKQTALYSLKLITRILAPTNQKPFIKLLKNMCSYMSDDMIIGVKSNSLLLMGELVGHLKERTIPFLPQILPLILNTLNEHTTLQNGRELLWISAITCLQRIVSSVPNFLSQFLESIVDITVTHTSNLNSPGRSLSGYMSHLPIRLKALRDGVATQFSSRILLPVLTKLHDQFKSQPEEVDCLMGILSEHIQKMNKEDLSAHHHQLLNLLISALDLRTLLAQRIDKTITSVEDAVIKCVLDMVMKLSESAFKPAYFKLYDWAVQDQIKTDRLITFYRLSCRLADQLKGLFGLFAGHVIQNISENLNKLVQPEVSEAEKMDTDIGLFSGGDGVYKEGVLRVSLIDCLYKCCIHDMDNFITKHRFELLTKPLVNQLRLDISGYDVMLSEHLIPCITQMCVSISDDSVCKPLIYQICLHTKDQRAHVRKGALSLLKNLCSKLGEDFMPLLPETIPFLAELMEDEDEEVESYCQQVLSDMENILGEPLQKYF